MKTTISKFPRSNPDNFYEFLRFEIYSIVKKRLHHMICLSLKKPAIEKRCHRPCPSPRWHPTEWSQVNDYDLLASFFSGTMLASFLGEIWNANIFFQRQDGIFVFRFLNCSGFKLSNEPTFVYFPWWQIFDPFHRPPYLQPRKWNENDDVIQTPVRWI